LKKQIKAETLTLTLDLKSAKDTGKGTYRWPPYLTDTTAAGAALGAHRADIGEPGARRSFATVRVGPKGIVAHPLDGGVLSLVGNALTSERTRSGATAHFSVLSWVVHLSDLVLALRILGLGKKGKQRV
jgi:hypothetical protein